MTTLIAGGTVVGFQNGGHTIFPDGEVAFSGDRILFVGRRFPGQVQNRIDARGKLVIPGFVNLHMAFGIHMQLYRLDAARPNFFNAGIGLGVQPAKAYHGAGPTSREWQASARHAMATALRTGTTTFAMVPNFGRHPFRGQKALVYCARGADVDTVIVDGITRLRERHLVDIDLDALRAAADVFNRKLRASVAQASYRDRPLTNFYEMASPE